MGNDILALKYAEVVGNAFKAATIHLDEIAPYSLKPFIRITNTDLG